MNCLCCGKALTADNTSGWHPACVKRFFGTTELPTIDIDEKTLELLATQSTNKGYGVPGVQKKLSLNLNSCKGTHRLTVVDCPTGIYSSRKLRSLKRFPKRNILSCVWPRLPELQPYRMLW